MKRRQFLQLMSCSASAATLPFLSCKKHPPIQAPNVVVICTDQHHPHMTGYQGHPYVKTPNLDQLANDGVSFGRAYCAQPVCTPSRMAFMTGRHIHDIKIWHNEIPLPPGTMTWAKKLDEAGIESVCMGHIHSPGEYYNPGFSRFKTHKLAKAWDPYPRDTPFPNRTPGYIRKISRDILLDSGPGQTEILYPRFKSYYDIDREVTDWSIDYIRQKASGDEKQPFTLYVGYHYPHWPYRVPQKYFDMYYPDKVQKPHDMHFPNEKLHPAVQQYQEWSGMGEMTDEIWRRATAAYYGMITCIDDMIGDIITELKQQNMYDNTYIIYMADHGESLGEHGLFFKQTPYEASVSIPVLLRGPDIPAGKRIDHPVSLVDLYPTLMDIAGIETESGRPGASWLPLARGEKHDRSDTVLAQWHGAGFLGAWYMLVRGEYKYVWYEWYRPSLFNMKKDPKEMNDLATDPAFADILEEFEAELNSILDPVAVSRQAKKDEGLITAEGKDLTRPTD